MIGRHEGPFHAARRLTEQHVMSLSSAPRALLKTASLLMMALSVATAAFIGFELGTKLILITQASPQRSALRYQLDAKPLIFRDAPVEPLQG